MYIYIYIFVSFDDVQRLPEPVMLSMDVGSATSVLDVNSHDFQLLVPNFCRSF